MICFFQKFRPGRQHVHMDLHVHRPSTSQPSISCISITDPSFEQSLYIARFRYACHPRLFRSCTDPRIRFATGSYKTGRTIHYSEQITVGRGSSLSFRQPRRPVSCFHRREPRSVHYLCAKWSWLHNTQDRYPSLHRDVVERYKYSRGPPRFLLQCLVLPGGSLYGSNSDCAYNILLRYQRIRQEHIAGELWRCKRHFTEFWCYLHCFGKTILRNIAQAVRR